MAKSPKKKSGKSPNKKVVKSPRKNTVGKSPRKKKRGATRKGPEVVETTKFKLSGPKRPQSPEPDLYTYLEEKDKLFKKDRSDDDFLNQFKVGKELMRNKFNEMVQSCSATFSTRQVESISQLRHESRFFTPVPFLKPELYQTCFTEESLSPSRYISNELFKSMRLNDFKQAIISDSLISLSDITLGKELAIFCLYCLSVTTDEDFARGLSRLLAHDSWNQLLNLNSFQVAIANWGVSCLLDRVRPPHGCEPTPEGARPPLSRHNLLLFPLLAHCGRKFSPENATLFLSYLVKLSLDSRISGISGSSFIAKPLTVFVDLLSESQTFLQDDLLLDVLYVANLDPSQFYYLLNILFIALHKKPEIIAKLIYKYLSNHFGSSFMPDSDVTVKIICDLFIQNYLSLSKESLPNIRLLLILFNLAILKIPSSASDLDPLLGFISSLKQLIAEHQLKNSNLILEELNYLTSLWEARLSPHGIFSFRDRIMALPQHELMSN